jgi:hypothetical protein
MSDDAKPWIALAAFSVLAVAAIIALSVFSAHMESSAYNRLTGASTTWWDAMWVELRVMDQPTSKEGL